MCYTIIMVVLDEVKRIQVERGLTNKQMSEILGYQGRNTWAKIKGGIVPANEVFIMRAKQAFPELVGVPAENAQDKDRGGIKGILDKIALRVKKFV